VVSLPKQGERNSAPTPPNSRPARTNGPVYLPYNHCLAPLRCFLLTRYPLGYPIARLLPSRCGCHCAPNTGPWQYPQSVARKDRIVEQAPSVRGDSDWTTGQVVAATLLVVAIVATFWLAYHLRLVILTFFLAILLSIAIRPGVVWLRTRGVSRAMGIIVIYVILFVAFVGFLLLVVPRIVTQTTALIGQLPIWYQGLRQLLLDSGSDFLHHLAEELPAQPPIEALVQPSQGQRLETLTQSVAYARTLGWGVLIAIATFGLAFFWTLEGSRIVQYALLFTPMDKRETIRELIPEIKIKVGGYVRAQALLMSVIALLALIAYALIGLPYTLVLALFAGLLELVPVIGPALGAIPALAVALSVDPTRVLWVIIATLAIQAFENTTLVPRIMHKTVGVNPVVTLIALAAFGSLFGLAGALLAVPLAAIIQLLFDHFVFTEEEPGQEELAGRDYVSVLRYEAQELARDAHRQDWLQPGEDGRDMDEIQDAIEAIAEEIDQLLAEAEQGQEERASA